MKYAIVLPTYYRPDGKTKSYLSRCLLSIKNQKYQDYHVFLIGDDYTQKKEFKNLSESIIDKSKITPLNLPEAVERKRYAFGTTELWCTGGINATNVGIDLALENGYNHICHLDHDDLWYDNHLFEINRAFETFETAAIVHTMSEYRSKTTYLPSSLIMDGSIVKRVPMPRGLIRSSVCIDHSKVNLRYRDVHFESNYTRPAVEGDIDLWNRVGVFLKENSHMSSHLVTSVTVSHLEEGYSKSPTHRRHE